MTEQFEKDLLREADALLRLKTLFGVFTRVLENYINEDRDYIDEKLINVLIVIGTEAYNVLNGTVRYKKAEVEGIEIQLARVMSDIETFQAGLPAKGEEHRHDEPTQDDKE